MWFIQLAPLWVPLLTSVMAIENILLLGDSLDRGIQHAWCARYNTDVESAQVDWGDETIKYGGHYGVKHVPAYCADPSTNDSISAVHIHGSNSNGPYFISSHEISAPLPHVVRNTTYRIQTSIQQYIELFGLPTKVYLNTEAWDLQGFNGQFFNLLDFKTNILERLEEIRIALNNKRVLIGLRTTPAPVKTARDMARMIQLNDYVRELCMVHTSHCQIFYDYDYDIWGIENFERTYDNHDLMFEDTSHPKPQFAADAGEKLLTNVFSKFYRNHNVQAHVLRSETSGKLYYAVNLLYHPMRNASETYTAVDHHYRERRRLESYPTGPDATDSAEGLHYAPFSETLSQSSRNMIHHMRNTRQYLYGGIEVQHLRCLRLSESDIVVRPESDINMVPTMGSFPYQMFKLNYTDPEVFKRGIVTLQLFMYLAYPDDLHTGCVKVERVNNLTTLQRLLPRKHIIYGVNNMWMHLLDLIPPPDQERPSIESYFEDYSLLRYHIDRQVYVVVNMTKYTIPGVSVMYKYGWDFDQVKVITDPMLLAFLPDGGPMT